MTPEELDRQLQSLVDGSLDPALLSELEAVLMRDESARMLYLDIVELESQLSQRELSPGVNDIVPMERLLARQKRKSFRVAMIATVAVCMIAVFIGLQIILPDETYVRLESSAGSEFLLTHSPGEGDEVPTGNKLAEGSRLQVKRGTVQLTFESGVVSVIRAPADLTLQEDSLVKLEHGNTWFKVPPEAIGFRVKTPEFLLTDLGTEFGIVSRLESPDVVQVLDGEVQLDNLAGAKETKVLSKGGALKARPDGGWDSTPAFESELLTSLPSNPALPEHLHWSFDHLEDEGLPVAGSLPMAKKLPITPPRSSHPINLVPGQIGKALSFAGEDSGLSTYWAGVSGSRSRTVAFWLKIPPGGCHDAQVIGWGNWHNREINGQWSLRVTSNKIYSSTNKETKTTETRVMVVLGHCWFTSQKNLDDGKWHHITARYEDEPDKLNRPVIGLFIDGISEPVEYHAWSANPLPVDTRTYSLGASPLAIGSPKHQPGLTAFSGEIDELYVFSSFLQETEIYALARPDGRVRQ